MNNTVKNTPSGKVFYFKQEWFDVLSEMSAKVRLQVYEAVMMYQATGMVPEEMTKVARMAFHFIRKEIDLMNGVAAGTGESDSTAPADQKHDERNINKNMGWHKQMLSNAAPQAYVRVREPNSRSATSNPINSNTAQGAPRKTCA